MRRLVPGIAAGVLLGACGGAGTTGTVRTAPATTAATQTLTTTAQPPPAVTQTGTAVPLSTTASTSTTASSSNVRLPATFTIEANGALTPPTVSAPAGVTIGLTVISRSRRVHHVVIDASPRRSLTVPAAGRASVAVEGLKTGRHAIDVDGVARGALQVGVAPGP